MRYGAIVFLVGATCAVAAEPEKTVLPNGHLSLGTAVGSYQGTTTVAAGVGAQSAPSAIRFGVPGTGETKIAAPATLATSLGGPVSTGTIALKDSPPMVPEMIERHGEAVRKMLVAITAADFPGFLFQGDKRFQTFDVEKFNALSRAWAARLTGGFGTTFLGELTRRNGLTSLWRVRLNDKHGDVLVILETNSRGSVSDIVLF